jgi:hypothetical protein
MDKSKALDLLSSQLTSLRQFGYQEDSPDKWRRDTKVVLEQVFGQKSPQAKEFERLRFGPGGFVRDKSRQLALDKEAFNREIPRAVSLLESMISQVEQFWDESVRRDDEGSTKPGLLRVACAGGLSLVPPLAFELCVHLIPWPWMRDHPNTLPLQIGGSAFLFLGCLGLFVPQWRKWFWRGALFPLALVVLKLLGGRSAPSLP